MLRNNLLILYFITLPVLLNAQKESNAEIQLFNKLCQNIYSPTRDLSIKISYKLENENDKNDTTYFTYFFHNKNNKRALIYSVEKFDLLRDSVLYRVDNINKTITVQHQKFLNYDAFYLDNSLLIKSIYIDTIETQGILYKMELVDSGNLFSVEFMCDFSKEKLLNYTLITPAGFVAKNGMTTLLPSRVEMKYDYSVKALPKSWYKMKLIDSLNDPILKGYKTYKSFEIFDFYHE